MTGSKQKKKFELYGCVEIAPGKPSFGLPVFRSSIGSRYGQIIDEVSGKIVDFRPIDAEGLSILPVSSTQIFAAGDFPAYCVLTHNNMCIGGSASKIKPALVPFADDDSISVGFRVQVSSLYNLGNEKFLRRSMPWKLESETAPASRAYQRSIARSILWRELVNSAKNASVAERTLQIRPQLDVDVHSDGSVKLHLGTISAADYPALDFSTLPVSIEMELGLAAPSNDDGEIEESQEQLFSITSKELRHFMNMKIGPDGRISEYTYKWTADLLKSLGFKNLDQLDDAISGYSGRQLSYVATGNLQGQATKLELMLLAAMGENYSARHPWGPGGWLKSRNTKMLMDFAKANIPIKDFDPSSRLRHGPGGHPRSTGP